MRNNNRITYLFAAVLIMTVATVMIATHGQSQNRSASTRSAKDDEDFGPIADYSPLQPADAETRIKRQKKDGRFRKEILEERLGSNKIIISNEWLYGLPALPVALSDIIVIGQITNAQAYLSPGKTGIFSEFNILPEEVLKGDKIILLPSNNTLIAEREGGRIRYPSGKIQQYKFIHQGMPHVGGRYVLFLRHTEQGESPYILTAYELDAGRVFPVDGVDGSKEDDKLGQFTAYQEAEERSFLKTIRDVITKESQTLSEGVK